MRFVGKRRRRCPKRRFFAGKPNKCADDGSSVTALFSVNLPGFRRGDPAWSPVNAKNFISKPTSSARDQLCPLRGFAAKIHSPYGWFFFFPKKHCFLGTLPCIARPTMHFSRATARVSGSGDHVGSPLRVSVCPFRNSRHSVKGFSTRHSRALDETSRFRATTRRQNTPYIAHFSR